MSRKSPIFIKVSPIRPFLNSSHEIFGQNSDLQAPERQDELHSQSLPELTLHDSLIALTSTNPNRIDISECTDSLSFDDHSLNEIGSHCGFQDLNSNDIPVITDNGSPFNLQTDRNYTASNSNEYDTTVIFDKLCETDCAKSSTPDRKEQVNICSICNQTFAHRSTLRQHYQIHAGDRPHKCEHCGKAFTKKFSLNQHVRLHTGNLPYKCDQCDKRFNTKANCQNHYYVHTGGFPYICDICKAGFRKKIKLLIHYDIHSNPKEEEAMYMQMCNKRTKTPQCDVCGKTFSKPFKLKQHYRVHTGEKPFKCEECGKGFSQKTLLKTHSYTHTRDYPYICYICDKGFRDSSRLRTHFNSHHSVNVKSS